MSQEGTYKPSKCLFLGHTVVKAHNLLLHFSKNVIACAKHFVGDGGTEKGKNEGNTIGTYDELEKIHMAPYVDCIAQGVSTIMASYSSWNGDNMHAHRYLLTHVLKEKLGFKVIDST